MKRTKIIVFGMGQEFRRWEKAIQRCFEVIACTDNVSVPQDIYWSGKFIKPDAILNCAFEKILICSTKYRDEIFAQLINMGGIPPEKIADITFLESVSKQNAYEEVLKDIEEYKKQVKIENDFQIHQDSLYLICENKYETAGKPGSHYFAQDIWGANKIYLSNPFMHYDIGSSLNGFIAHLLVFREVYYIDIRPMDFKIPGLHFRQGDAMNLDGIEDNSIESLSSFHALEHFGLGRYGDPIDPEGYIKAAISMQRVLMRKGHLYIGVPIGPKDKLVFNAHRIFKIETVLKLFDQCNLVDIAVVEPDGVFAHSIEMKDYERISEFSCGLFEFEKKWN